MNKKIFLMILGTLLIGTEIGASAGAKQSVAVADGEYDGTMGNAHKSIATLLNRLRSSKAIGVASQRAKRDAPIKSNAISASASAEQPAQWRLVRCALTVATPVYYKACVHDHEGFQHFTPTLDQNSKYVKECGTPPFYQSKPCGDHKHFFPTLARFYED